MALWNSLQRFWKEDVTVEPAVFLYMAAIFMEISVTQDLIFSNLCLNSANVTNVLDCQNLNHSIKQEITYDTTRWNSYYSASMFVFTLIATSYVGSWSDRFSRKYTMLIPPIGSIIACIVLAAFGAHLNWPIEILLIAGFISGISGGTTALLTSAFGHIADITTKESRTKRIVILEAMIFAGGTVGMSGGGALNKYMKVQTEYSEHYLFTSSFAVVFLLELTLVILSVLSICFCVHDFHPPGQEPRPPLCSQGGKCKVLYELFNLKHVIASVKTVFKSRPGNKRSIIGLLLLTSFLVLFSMAVQQTLLYVYLSSEPLKWTPEMYSYYNATNFGISGFALIVGVVLAFHVFKVPDTIFGMLGILSKMTGLIVLGLSTTTTLAFLSTLFFIFSEFPVPAIRSILSKQVDPDEKGKIFAFVQFLQNLSYIISSQIFSQLFVATSSIFQGLSFEIVAILQAGAFLILLYIHHKLKDAETPYEHMINNPDFSPNENST